MVHDHSLPLGDRDEEENGWTAKAIADDIRQWNEHTSYPQEKVDILNPTHPEMAPHQKQDVIYYLTKELRDQTEETTTITSPAACWAVAELSGWHRPSCDLITDLALIGTEVSEGVQALRRGVLRMTDGDDSVEEELADVVIRVFHTAQKNGFDIIGAIRKKHEKNKQRPYRHGNKKF